jgi:radical SAM protein with 4Fe4S-binding SPASM domain
MFNNEILKEFQPIKGWYPLEAQIEITYDCTLRCPMCYNGVRANEKKFSDYINECNFKDISPDKEEKLKNVVATCLKNGARFFTITGGEPLLYPELVLDLIEMIKEYGCYASINSNATVVTPELAKKLKSVGLNSAMISCHGPDDDTHRKIVGVSGAWGRTINGIRALLDNGIRVVPNFVASHTNIDKMQETSEMLYELGLKVQSFSMFIPTPGVESHEGLKLTLEDNEKYFRQLDYINKVLGVRATATLPVPPCLSRGIVPPEVLKSFEFRNCPSGRQFMVVNAEGNASPCIQFAWNEKYGSNLENPDMTTKLAQWKSIDKISEKCFRCAAKGFCNPCNMNILREHEFEGIMSLGREYEPYPGYRGLTEEESASFKKKFEIVVSTNDWNKPYRLKDGMMIRAEEDGILTIINPQIQAYTVIDGLDLDELTDAFTFSEPEHFQLFSAMDLLVPVTNPSIVYGLDNLEMVPKYKFLTEFVGWNFDTEGVVYMTRTDTAGRYFCLPNNEHETEMYRKAREDYERHIPENAYSG